MKYIYIYENKDIIKKIKTYKRQRTLHKIKGKTQENIAVVNTHGSNKGALNAIGKS